MSAHQILSIALASSACCWPAQAQLYEFNEDREGWFGSVADVTTIGFWEVPDGTFLSDEYAHVGVLFTDGLDITGCCAPGVYPVDGAGLDGEGFIDLSFSVPQHYIAADFPGELAFELYRDGRLIGTSSSFGSSGYGLFGGVISAEPFDAAVLFREFNDYAFVDDLHFGPALCGADLAHDRRVGPADLLALLSEWGAEGTPADLDGDGAVAASDLLALLMDWGPCPSVAVTFPEGRPVLSHPEGSSVAILFSDVGDALDPGSPVLHYDTGDGPVDVAAAASGGGAYTAPLPAAPCGTLIRWSVTARSAGGDPVTAPASAPEIPFVTASAASRFPRFEDTMELAGGWLAGAPGDDATAGAWTLADPEPGQGGPPDDHTPVFGTKCWVTGARDDVDGGVTTLTSPPIDLSGASEALIGYWRWFSNDAGAAPGEDVLAVELSNDDGATWVCAESVGPQGPEASGGWFRNVLSVSRFMAPTGAMRLRFVASDHGADSTVEAAIDDLTALELCCQVTLAGDFDGDGVVGTEDLLELLSEWGFCPGNCHEDLDGDGAVGTSDLLIFLAGWGPCTP